MKLKYALQTLIAVALWLFLQNFNVSTRWPSPTEDASGGKSTYKIKKIVLDAGHGGKDPGCLGAVSREKHNALAIVLNLGDRIKKAFPEVEVIYTRDKDVFVELNERAAIANRNNADLFVSVHCNAVSSPSIHGAETYVMGLHTAQHNLDVAKRENASIYLEDNYQQKYEGYDPNSPESHILSSLWQSAYLEQSILFASLVQQYAKSIGGRVDKGVKQAGFIVLKETAMPAVLFETGFLTNRSEEQYIASEEGQNQMAQAIFVAFTQYKNQMEGSKATATVPAKPATTAPPAKPDPKPTTVSVPIKGAFRIHLLDWPSRLDLKSGQLALLSDVKEEKVDKQYRYFVGSFTTRTEAEKELSEIKNLGFRTASVVPIP